MELMIFLATFASLPFLITYIFDSKEIYRHNFYWSKWDGIGSSTIVLRKYKRFDIYFIRHQNDYRTCQEHPDYKEILNKIEDIKKINNQ